MVPSFQDPSASEQNAVLKVTFIPLGTIVMTNSVLEGIFLFLVLVEVLFAWLVLFCF